MSDMGDDFRYFRELSKKKRADNYEYSTDKLDELGLKDLGIVLLSIMEKQSITTLPLVCGWIEKTNDVNEG